MLERSIEKRNCENYLFNDYRLKSGMTIRILTLGSTAYERRRSSVRRIYCITSLIESIGERKTWVLSAWGILGTRDSSLTTLDQFIGLAENAPPERPHFHTFRLFHSATFWWTRASPFAPHVVPIRACILFSNSIVTF